MKTCKKALFNKLLVYAVIFLIAFLFMTSGTMNIFQILDTGTDSSVFRTVALMMKNGYTPYKDSFDHKGPLLYVINYLGLLINYDHGVWFIEIVFMFFTCLGIFKISRLSCGVFPSLLIILVCFNPLFWFFGGGNKTEEYAMSFIAWGLFIFLDYFLNGKINRLRLFVCGFGCGCILMLQPNMASMWVVFCLAVLADAIIKKQLKTIPEFLLFFCLGMLLAIVPFIIWFAAKGALKSFWDTYIGFNYLYTSFRDGGISLSDQWAVALTFLSEPAILLAFSSITVIFFLKKDFLSIIYLLYILFALFMASVSGFFYEHYFMVMIPAIAYPISLLFRLCSEKGADSIVSALLAVCLLFFALPEWLNLAAWLPGYYNTRNVDCHSEDVKALSAVICENTSAEDRISVYGNWDMLYIHSGRLHATRFSFTAPVIDFSAELKDEYFSELEEELPACIIVQLEFSDERMSVFLSENGYEEIFTLDSDNAASVYIKA